MFVQLTNNAHVGDDVVLNVDEMNMTSSVEYLEGESLKEFVGDGYVGNYRGVKSGEVTLLLKVAPFEMSLLVKGESVMSLNTNQMMHFEKKRDPTTKEKRKLTVEENEKPKKSEKEIVGYWEDGLAIYADGTREERSET